MEFFPEPVGADGQSHFYVANFKDYRFLRCSTLPAASLLVTAGNGQATALSEPTTALRAHERRLSRMASIWCLPEPKPGTRIPEGQKLAEHANDPNETPIQYEPLPIPFNEAGVDYPNAAGLVCSSTSTQAKALHPFSVFPGFAPSGLHSTAKASPSVCIAGEASRPMQVCRGFAIMRLPRG